MISIWKSKSRIKIFRRLYQADRRILGGSPQGILRKATDILFLKKLTLLRVSFCKLLPWPAKTNERTNEWTKLVRTRATGWTSEFHDAFKRRPNFSRRELSGIATSGDAAIPHDSSPRKRKKKKGRELREIDEKSKTSLSVTICTSRFEWSKIRAV